MLKKLNRWQVSGVVGLLLSAAIAQAQPAQRLERLRIGYAAIASTQAGLVVIKDAGIFEKHGFAVQLIFAGSGGTAILSLLAGELPIVQSTGVEVVHSVLAGSDAAVIAGVMNHNIFHLITSKEITRPEQLKGKRAAVSRFGTVSDFSLRQALKHLGVDPEREITILQLGTEPNRFAAMQAGSVQATVVTPPLTLNARKVGFNTLADLQALGVEFQHTSLSSTRSYMKKNPETVRRFMRAFVTGIHYIKTHRPETLRSLAKFLRMDDREILEETYDQFLLKLVPQKPYPTLKGIQAILDDVATRNPKARDARPEQFVDLQWVRELDESGYIDRLYRP